MSHVATIPEADVRDLDALAEAAQRVGCELVRGQTTYRWYGHSVGDYPLPAGFAAEDLGTCEHALRVKGNTGAYEVGIVQRHDGRPGYVMLWDFYAGGHGLQAAIGPDGCKLRQAYATVVAKRQAQRAGFLVTEQARADGAVVLSCRKAGGAL